MLKHPSRGVVPAAGEAAVGEGYHGTGRRGAMGH